MKRICQFNVFFTLRTAILLGCIFLPTHLFAQTADVYEEETIEETEDLSLYFEKYEPVGNRFFSAGLSLVIPGAGQMLNDEYLKGVGFALVALTTSAAASGYNIEQYERERPQVEAQSDTARYVTHNKLMRDTYTSAQINTHLYAAFDAYRLSSIANDTPRGVVPVTNESMLDLALAPFTPKYVNDSYVFVPFIATALFVAGRSGSRSINRDDFLFFRYSDDLDRPTIVGVNLIRQEITALGEEAFFRGVVNTETMRYFGPAYGVLASSALFGLTHTNEGVLSNPVSASIYGIYLGYVHKIKNGQLGYNVALHYWWNIAVIMATIDRSQPASLNLITLQY